MRGQITCHILFNFFIYRCILFHWRVSSLIFILHVFTCLLSVYFLYIIFVLYRYIHLLLDPSLFIDGYLDPPLCFNVCLFFLLGVCLVCHGGTLDGFLFTACFLPDNFIHRYPTDGGKISSTVLSPFNHILDS